MRKCLFNLFCFLSLVFVFSTLCFVESVNAAGTKTSVTLTGSSFDWYFVDVNGEHPDGWQSGSDTWKKYIAGNTTSYFSNLQVRFDLSNFPGITTGTTDYDMGITIYLTNGMTVTANRLSGCFPTTRCSVFKTLYSSSDVSIFIKLNNDFVNEVNLYSNNNPVSFVYVNNSNADAEFSLGVDRIRVDFWSTDPNAPIVDAIGGMQDLQVQTNDKLDDVTSSIDETNLLLQQQSEQDQSQYEQEKQEEAERENELDGDSSQAQGVFSFSVFNPFLPLFSMFNVNQCVSIPTLSNMLGSSETQYCSWFDGTTRGILTPVMSIASVMLIFGFVIRWLGGSSIITFGGKV